MISDIGAEMGGTTKAFSQIHSWHRHVKDQLQQLPWRSTKCHWSKGAAKQLIGHYCASWQFGQAPSAVILAWVSGIMSIKTAFSKSTELPAHFAGKWQALEKKNCWTNPLTTECKLWYDVNCQFRLRFEGQNATLVWCIVCVNPKATNWKAYRKHPQTINDSSYEYDKHVWSTPPSSSSFGKSDQHQPWEIHSFQNKQHQNNTNYPNHFITINN